MAYCTLDDLKDKIPEADLIQLCFDGDAADYATDELLEAAQAAAVAEKTAEAIADADAEIGSYCARRYAVPLSPAPRVIRKLSAEMAIYGLFSRRQGAPEDWEKRYANAVRLLRDISKGVVSIGDPDASEASPGSEAPSITSSDRVFSRDGMKGF